MFYDIWSEDDQEYRLGLFAEAGKKVFNIEYIAPADYEDYAAVLADQTIDILGYAADPDRALDVLITGD